MADRWERANGEYLIPFEDGMDQYEPLYKIPVALFVENRARLAKAMRDAGHTGVVLIHGGVEANYHSTDTEQEFVQEPYFYWAYGAQEAGFKGSIDIQSGKSTLFIPRLPETYAVWFGSVYPPEYFQKKYLVDEVHFEEEMAATLKGNKLYVLEGVDTDSKSKTEATKFEGIETFDVDREVLHPIFSELRVFKTEKELNALRYVCRISCRAHVELMQTIKPGNGEHQAEALFKFASFAKGGCRHCSYCCIGATGVDNATLHYPLNDKKIKDGSLALFDMGAKYESFCSDVTCSFPVNGKFTDEQKIVYNAVLDANRTVMRMMKPGQCWKECHRRSLRVILEHLLKAGIVQGDIEEMTKVHLGALFMAHGLGHLIGLQTHDVGGFNGGVERPTEPGISRLRTARVLQAGMYITNEPGLYFNNYSLEQAFKNPEFTPFLNEKLIREKYWDIGGVRIEDNVLITEDGCEVFSNVPRTVEEIEEVIAGREWSYGTIRFINVQ